MGMVSKTEGQAVSTERLSSKWVFDANGQPVELALDELAHDYDPATGEYRGVLVEPEATNLASHSWDFVKWSRKQQYRVGFEYSGETFMGDPVAKAVHNDGFQWWLTLEEPEPEGAWYTMSMYIRADGDNGGNSRFRMAHRNTSYGAQPRFYFDDGGYLTMSNGYEGCSHTLTPVNGGGKDGGYIVTVTTEVYAGDTPFAGMHLDDTDGFSFYIGRYQLERSPFATSYIPTNGAAATRPADVVTLDNSGEHYNPSQGTWVLGVDSAGGNAMVGIGADAAKLTGKGTFVYAYDETGGEGFAAGGSVFTTPRHGSRPTELTLGDQLAPVHVRQVRYYPYRMVEADARAAAAGDLTVDYLFSGGQSLVLDFMNKDFGYRSASDGLSATRSAELADVMSFSRTTPATYWGADGKLKLAEADEPRYDHDPVTREPLGLLIESEATNLMNWPAGESMIASLAGDFVVAADQENSISDLLPSITLESVAGVYRPRLQFWSWQHDGVETVYTRRLFVKPEGIQALRYGTDGSGHNVKNILLDVEAGTVSSNSEVIREAVRALGNGWYELTFTQDSEDPNHTRHWLRLDAHTDGEARITVCQPEIYAGHVAGSVMLPAEAPTTRGADLLTREIGDEVEQDAGTWVVTGQMDYVDTGGGFSLLRIPVTNYHYTRLIVDTTTGRTGQLAFVSRGDDGVQKTVDTEIHDMQPATPFTAAGSYGAERMAVAINGLSYGEDIPNKDWPEVRGRTLMFYSDVNCVNYYKRIEYHPYGMDEAELATLTDPNNI